MQALLHLHRYALGLCAALVLLLAAPAFASHLKGGSVSAAIGADQHLSGRVELIYRSAGACPATPSQLTGAPVQVSGPSGFSATPTLTNDTMASCLPSTKTESADYDVDISAGADGTYTVTYSNCCRVTPIANVAGGAAGSTAYTATIQKSGSTVTSTPSLASNVALGVSTQAAYDQNIGATSAAGSPLTYLLLQSATPAQPDYDATAPSSNIVTISSGGQVSIPAGTTSGLVVGTVYVYKVRVADAAGNSVEREILLTVSANNVPALDGPQSPVTVTAGDTVLLTLTATDADGAQLVTILPSGLPGWATLSATAGNPASATITLAPPAATTAQDIPINVDATDNDSTAPMTASRVLTLRVAALVLRTALGSVPARLTNERSPSVPFAGEPSGASFECSLDGGDWTACASPWSPATPLADGEHTLRVRATFGGQVQSDPPSASWTTDATPPAAPKLLGSPGRNSATTAAITFSGEPGAAFSCRLDGGSWTPCTSPRRYTGLALGAHSVQVRQTDAAGNVGDAATATWTIVAEQAAGRLAVRAPAAIVASSARPSVACRAIGGALTSCSVRAYVRATRRDGRKVRVLVGRGRIGAVAAGASRRVRLRLTAFGRRALSRVGGVKVELRVAGRATTGRPLRTSQRVRLLPVQARVVTERGIFPSGSAVMTAAGRRSVNRLARRMHHVKAVVCTGYTDSIGNFGYNASLALARARAVCGLLHARRPNMRVRTRGSGENRPAASNRTASGRAANRRVVVRLRYR